MLTNPEKEYLTVSIFRVFIQFPSFVRKSTLMKSSDLNTSLHPNIRLMIHEGHSVILKIYNEHKTSSNSLSKHVISVISLVLIILSNFSTHFVVENYYCFSDLDMIFDLLLEYALQDDLEMILRQHDLFSIS